MKKYDRDEFKKITEVVKRNPALAKFMLEEYIKKYPQDYCSYNYYSYTLIKLGLFQEAMNITEYSKSLWEKDYNIDEKKKIYLRHHEILNIMRILSFQGKYLELLSYYYMNADKVPDVNTSMIPYYCKKKLGILDDDYSNHGYLINQIINYDEDKFIEIIGNNYKLGKYFYDNFPLKEIIKEIKQYIPSNIKLYNNFCEEEYSFRYDACGVDDNETVNHFKATIITGTNNFLFMYPTLSSKEKPQIDLNYMRYNSATPKIRRLSQIEKFNNKYKKN